MKWTAGILAGLLVIASRPTHGFCLNWSSLEGYTLTESTELRKLECYEFSDKYDCFSWPNGLYEMDGRCYEINDFKPRRRHRLDFRA